MNFQDTERSKLRSIVADIERQLPALSIDLTAAGHSGAAGSFTGSWAALVEILALGPEPEVRKCPLCSQTIRRDATRCMHCWKPIVAE